MKVNGKNFWARNSHITCEVGLWRLTSLCICLFVYSFQIQPASTTGVPSAIHNVGNGKVNQVDVSPPLEQLTDTYKLGCELPREDVGLWRAPMGTDSALKPEDIP